MESAIARKGKDCIAHVNNTGHADKASLQLATLKEDGADLEAEAQALAGRLEKVEEYHRQQGEDIQQKIGDYGHREEELQRQKSSVESKLSGQRSVLQSNQSRLAEAQSALRSAEQWRRNKEREADNLQYSAMVIGAVVGIFTFGIGTLAGAATCAAAGAALGSLINELREEEKKAERHLECCRSDRSNAQSSVEASERQIHTIQSEIASISVQIEEMKQQRLRYHRDAGEVKEAIVFVRESIEFWQLFKEASAHGVNRTELLHRIVEKARETSNLQILRNSASQRVTATFMEAWESMESMAAEGGTKNLLQIAFKCTQCDSNHTALPYVKDESFVCTACYSKLAIA